MPAGGRWQELSPSEWDAFVKAWLAELRDPSPAGESDIGQAVVMMNFMAPPQLQWEFICAAAASAESDGELAHIAAGPVEQLLGRHGPEFIARVEARAAADPTFARMLTGVWRHTMSDDVWARVQAVQDGVPDPLSDERA